MDLIDRQAAIEVLDVGAELLRRVLDETDVVGAEREKYKWGLGLIESYIADMEELPSAQPDSSFITWLLDEIWDEDMWELNWQAFPEILCRKMAKLGYIRERNGEYERLD